MLSINDLKSKIIVMIDGAPYQVLEVKHLHMGRGGSSVQTKIKNLVTGQALSRNFKPADSFKEADIEKRELIFLYSHRDEFTFSAKGKQGERYKLAGNEVGGTAQWLIPNTVVTALFLEGKLIQISVPIKMDLRVVEAPPGLRGDTVSGATKTVILETGAKIQTPLFVNEGDVIRVNTETGEYTERASKG